VIIGTPDPAVLFMGREGSPSDEAVVRETWVENVYRIEEGDLGPGKTFLDVGANIGAVSVYAARAGSYVVAVEPDPANLDYLRANMMALAPVGGYDIIEAAAVGGRAGTVRIMQCHGNTHISEDGQVEVDASTLEDIIMRPDMLLLDGDIDVCKVDIEGAEYELIEGTPLRVLERIRYLTLEFNAAPDDVFGLMVAKLAHSFAVTVLGSPERGGYIYARRYD